ncbi:flavin-containing amine oxidase [Aspergillus steynii IBT 23096]|uniref:Flavin-containing amine oxidase n=1 Tax=Aspergillus steynii IBT 23096 TaxID=1392250 RepID=A0A2I2GIU1_9EURO|nr:flavin-containing amine oxidase [Aspergillus steynii IBT 23096]PLB52788.1 flavin-containing amine oxidase [Aspergillus steynii IBT 23096]
MGKKPHVAIIGAGFSGLRCADILAQNGAQVTIFEARNRVGGRVHQSEVGNHLVDLGPNWIHGTGKNPIADIAALTKTTIADLEGEQHVLSSDGKLLDRQLAAKVSEFLWETIGEAFEYSNAHKETIPPSRSLLDFLKERIETTSLTPLEKELCIESSRLWGAYVGDPIEKQSLKFFCLEECIDGNNYFVASTYNAILQHVSKAAIEKADIRFNQPIVKIDSKVRDDAKTPGEIALTTAAGETFQFDEVVVTCPLGWLKRNQAAFTPELPARLTQAINNTSYGRLEKVYVTFPEAFWHKHTEDHSSNTSSTTTKPNGTPSSLNNTHEPPTFIQFLDPTYTNHPDNIIWNQECVSLASLPTHCAQPTLLFYTYGPCATHIVSALKDIPPSSPAYNTYLDTFLRPFYSRLPGFDPVSCKPLAFLATQWQNDPYAGHGSYCNFQSGLEHGDRDIEVLRAGVGMDRGVWFAGEHTAPFVALGTTTGAYWSGERAAAKVCALYGLGTVGVGVERDDSLPSAMGKGVDGG